MLKPADFTIKQGDTLPRLEATLLDSLGVIPITGPVEFHLKDHGTGEVVLSAAAIVVSAMGGQVAYDWQPGDTDVPGYYLGEWQITQAPGKILTVPNDYYDLIRITPQAA